MDDQPKEGGEGDKKIVHTYALVKVILIISSFLPFYSMTTTCSIFTLHKLNYPIHYI